MGGQYRKPTVLRRRSAVRQPRRRFTLFCEGRKTEPSYFEALRHHFSEALIEIDAVGGVGEPGRIARTATKEKEDRKRARRRRVANSFEENDEIWAVFDRDTHPRFEEALSICRDASIPIAVSNPCFEVWLIFHIEVYDRPCSSEEAQKYLQSLCPEYSHSQGACVDSEKLIPRLDFAVETSLAALRRRSDEGDELGAPSSTVHELIVALRRTR